MILHLREQERRHLPCHVLRLTSRWRPESAVTVPVSSASTMNDAAPSTGARLPDVTSSRAAMSGPLLPPARATDRAPIAPVSCPRRHQSLALQLLLPGPRGASTPRAHPSGSRPSGARPPPGWRRIWGDQGAVDADDGAGATREGSGDAWGAELSSRERGAGAIGGGHSDAVILKRAAGTSGAGFGLSGSSGSVRDGGSVGSSRVSSIGVPSPRDVAPICTRALRTPTAHRCPTAASAMERANRRSRSMMDVRSRGQPPGGWRHSLAVRLLVALHRFGFRRGGGSIGSVKVSGHVPPC